MAVFSLNNIPQNQDNLLSQFELLRCVCKMFQTVLKKTINKCAVYSTKGTTSDAKDDLLSKLLALCAHHMCW